ncbi:MAG: 30S ribosomal protein S16 [Patescibacteria group bacterium]|jgi:small subunit ribosomal protein S16
MLTIRLSRVGKKNKPLYRVIISEKHKDVYGDSLEILGSYNPHTKELKIDAEKTKYWISKGAGMSDTVNNLLIEKKIIEGKKLKASKARTPKKAPAPVKAAATSAPAETATPAPAEEPKVEQPAA